MCFSPWDAQQELGGYAISSVPMADVGDSPGFVQQTQCSQTDPIASSAGSGSELLFPPSGVEETWSKCRTSPLLWRHALLPFDRVHPEELAISCRMLDGEQVLLSVGVFQKQSQLEIFLLPEECFSTPVDLPGKLEKWACSCAFSPVLSGSSLLTLLVHLIVGMLLWRAGVSHPSA